MRSVPFNPFSEHYGDFSCANESELEEHAALESELSEKDSCYFLDSIADILTRRSYGGVSAEEALAQIESLVNESGRGTIFGSER